MAILSVLPWNIGRAQQPLQLLHNHVRPEVAEGRASLVGPLPGRQQINFSIVMPLRNQAALTTLLSQLYDPASPNFRQFLTVDQFTEQFGPTVGDYQAVVSFAQASGFTVTGRPANRVVVPVSGTVDQINQAFHVSMNVYQHPTEDRTFFSPDREPSLNLSVPIAHIAGLNNFSLPHPLVKQLLQGDQIANVTGSGPGGSYLASDMRAAYYGATTLNGTGQSVGLLEFDGYNLSDVEETFSNAGQSYNVAINNVLLDGATGAPVDSGEAEVVLDIVQAIGMAPGLSQVRVYIGTGQDDADLLNSMASENIAKQISCSWSWYPDDPTTDDVFFEEFAAQGQSFFAASGDYGAYDVAISPYFYPQEDAYVTAVGGTHLTTNGAAGTWASETAWISYGNGSGGGVSPDGISIPGWQSGVANSSNGGSTTERNVPDVAMEGDFDNYLCALGSCSEGWAGTSFAAPRWAGFMALVNQQAVEAGNAPKGGVGFLNPPLYTLAESSHYGSDLHDITTGNNDTENQPVWYSAVSGYDLVTGWGSPNGPDLINDLAGPQVPGFWLLAAPGLVSLDQGGSNSSTVTVTDAGGFTGNVSLAVTSTLPSGVTAAWGTNPTAGSSVLTLTASATAPTSTTNLTITGTSGDLTSTTNVSLAVHAPSFLLLASPNALGVNQGASGTSTIFVTPQYGFTGAVNLSVSGLPSGVTASFSPASTTTNSILTLTVSSTAPGGISTLTVTGTSGNLTETTTLALTVQGPFFTLSDYGILDIGQGTSVSTPVYVNAEYGFTGLVNLSVSGLPSGVSASFSPNPTSPGYETLTITASPSAPLGTSNLTITGICGNQTATTTLTLGIFVPTFTLSAGSLTIGQGMSSYTYVFLNPEYGFTGSVNLSVSGLPSGVTAFFNPNPVSSSYSTLTITASSSAPVSTSTLTITGTSGNLTATTTFTLGIFVPTFTLSAGNLTMGQGTSASTWVDVFPVYGFTGNVTFSVSGLPSGVTAAFAPNPTSQGSTTLILTASSSASVGTKTLTITGICGNQTATTTLTVGIFVPTFTLSAGSLTIGRGTSINTSVFVYPQYGFTGNITFSVSGLPSGVSVLWNPNPAPGSTNLTLTASTSTPIGTSTLIITGTCGSQTVDTTVTLSVFAPTFTLSAGGVTIGQGTSDTTYVYVYPEYGFTGNVSLSISGLPSGVTASFSPNPTVYSSTLTLTVSSTAAVGQYPLTVTGTSGSQTATTTLVLGVGAPSFTIQPSESSLSVSEGTSSSASIWLYPQFGFSGNVQFAATGVPNGVTASFSPNPSTSGTTLTLTASATATPGIFTVTITGTSGSVVAFTSIVVTVNTPNLTISSAPDEISLTPGGTGQSTILVSPQNGFDGSVSLAATGLPSGVTAVFSPNPTGSGSSVLTLTASQSAAIGTATVTISGTSGSLNAATSLMVTVATAPSATSTTLQVTAAGSPVTSVGAGTAIALAASVKGGSTALTTGQVIFCDATTPYCDLAHLLGRAQLTAAGTAIYRFIPGMGNHSYKAVYVATNGEATSSSAASNLAVTASKTSTTTIAQSGIEGDYSLTASVTGVGPVAPGGTVSFLDTSNNNSVLASAPLGNAETALTWANPQAPAISFYPNAGVVADFNGDGIPDLAVANSSGDTLTILLGNGDGTFTAVASSPQTGNDPYYVVAGDFNGDGKTDLAVANYQSNNMTILLGNGDGTFTPAAANPETGSEPSLIAVGDFNRDGILDLAVVDSGYETVTVLLGNGDGTFTPSPLSAQTGGYPESIVTADFNGDGILDLAVTNGSGGTVTVLLGNGDGSFTPAPSPITGSNPEGMAVGDFNQDGKPDLAVANEYNGTVTILLGNGDGTFTAGATIPVEEPVSVAVGDFNGDGKSDLAVASYYAGVAVLLGNGDGTFSAPTSASTGFYTDLIAVADFNGDGVQDFLTTTAYSESVSVQLAQLTQTVTATANNIEVAGSGIHNVEASYPGDSHYKSSVSATTGLTAGPITPTVTVSPSTGAISTAQALPVRITVTGPAGKPTPTGSITLTGGGYTSPSSTLSGGSVSITVPAGKLSTGVDTLIAAYTPDSGSSSTYGNASGSATVTVGQAIGSCANPNPNPNPNPASFANPGDFNGDCRSDILWRNSSSEEAYVWLMNGTSILNQGSPGGPSSAWVIEGVGDFNGDGMSDILWQNSSTGEVYIWLINGTSIANQGSPGTVSPSSGWVIAGLGDFNGDGKADILWRNNTTGDVSIWLMNGTSVAGQGDLGIVSPSSGWVIQGVGDFNGDGKADILWQNSTSGEIYIWLMNGTAISSQGSPGAVSASSGWVIQGAGDFDGNGTSDILWRNSSSGEIYIWFMSGTTITNQGSPGTVSTAWGIRGAGDYNGDGKTDILWQNTSGEVYIWEMNGLTITSQGSPGTVSSPWQISALSP